MAKTEAGQTAINGSLVQMRIGNLALHPLNVRRTYSQVGLEELAASISAQGILQPLVIVPRPIDYHEAVIGAVESQANFWILIGNRRFLAAQKAGLRQIPCIIREDLDTLAKQKTAMLVENLQREGLNPLERAQAFSELVHGGLSVAELARQIGRSQPFIRDHLAIKELPETVQRCVALRQISYVAAITANNAELTDTDRQLLLAELISEGLSVQQVKRRVTDLIQQQRQAQIRLSQAQDTLETAVEQIATSPARRACLNSEKSVGKVAGPVAVMAARREQDAREIALTNLDETTSSFSVSTLKYAFQATCQDCGLYQSDPLICQDCPVPKLLRLVVGTHGTISEPGLRKEV